MNTADQQECKALLAHAYHVLEQHQLLLRQMQESDDFDREAEPERFDLYRGQNQLDAVLFSFGKILEALVEEKPSTL